MLISNYISKSTGRGKSIFQAPDELLRCWSLRQGHSMPENHVCQGWLQPTRFPGLWLVE